MTERIAIVDSYGPQALHPRYRQMLAHVTFRGVEPPALRGRPVHGHASWCAWNLFSQARNPAECLFVRIFDEQGRGVAGTDPFVLDALRDFQPTRVSNSWGGGDAWTPAQIDDYMDAIGDATVTFAAGNEYRNGTSNPQKQLVGNRQIFIVGAIDRNGYRAKFSSTSEDNKSRYADIMYLGEGSMSLDGQSGQVVTWDGTSSSCPAAAGDLWARGLTWREADAYWRALVLEDANANGGPDGIHGEFRDLIRRGGFHPDVGRGVGEAGRQRNMKETGLGLGVVNAAGVRMVARSQFLDFDPI